MTSNLNDLRTAQEHLKYLDSISNEMERTRYMAFILATEANNATEPLLAQLQHSEAALSLARAGERERCCKDVCFYCKTGPQAELRQDGFYPAAYEHRIEMSPLRPGKYIWQPCVANAIRQRAAREGKGGESDR